MDSKIYGGPWKLIDSGNSVDLSDGTTTLASAPEDATSPFVFRTHTYSGSSESQTLVFGNVSPDVTYIVATGEGGNNAILVPLPDGRLAFWVWTMSVDRVIALDARCDVVAAIDLHTGAATTAKPPAECG